MSFVATLNGIQPVTLFYATREQAELAAPPGARVIESAWSAQVLETGELAPRFAYLADLTP
jgi:hypothetical protein